MERLGAVLQRVADGEIKRLMVFMPPRMGKSEQVSRLFSAYYLYRHPHEWVGINSYGADLAYTLSRAARDNYLRAGARIRGDVAAVSHWQTPEGGGMWAAGVGGPITGKGFHLGIIDDPLKNAEEANSATVRNGQKDWYDSAFYTRQEPGAAIIIIQTRWNEDDLSGWQLTREAEAPEHWHIVSYEAIKEDVVQPFPPTCTVEPDWRAAGDALCPERYDLSKLRRIEERLRGFWYALYQQRPQPPKGTVFQKDWFPRRNAIDRSTATFVVQAWDTAFKEGQDNDRSACITFALHPMGIWVLDAWKDTVAFPALVARMRAKAAEWRPHAILVEDKGSGTSALQTLRNETQLPIVAVKAQGTKVERANLITATCEAGRVIIPPSPWGDDLIDELVRFPTGAHDDQVDAFVYGLTRLVNSMHGMTVTAY